ncbi:MAG: TIGR03067 domain-containing protein [Gemmataceae bacterium]
MRMRALISAMFVGLIVQTHGFAQPAAKEPPPGSLTTESLKKMLQDLGYEPYASSPTATWFRVTITRENFNSVFSVSISGGGGTSIWFESQANVDLEKIPGPALLKLLTLNEEIGPSYFSIDAKRKAILLNNNLPNRDWTNARMRKNLDAFADLVRRTWPSWNPAAIVPIVVTDSEEAKSERQKFQGEWKVVNQETSGRRSTDDEIAKRGVSLHFKGTKAIFKGTSGSDLEFSFHLDPTKSPREMELQSPTGKLLVIYRFADDRLTINYCDVRRPTQFETAPGDQCTKIVMERVK